MYYVIAIDHTRTRVITDNPANLERILKQAEQYQEDTHIQFIPDQKEALQQTYGHLPQTTQYPLKTQTILNFVSSHCYITAVQYAYLAKYLYDGPANLPQEFIDIINQTDLLENISDPYQDFCFSDFTEEIDRLQETLSVETDRAVLEYAKDALQTAKENARLRAQNIIDNAEEIMRLYGETIFTDKTRAHLANVKTYL